MAFANRDAILAAAKDGGGELLLCIVKHYTGTAWEDGLLRIYDGNGWIGPHLKYHDGDEWVDV